MSKVILFNLITLDGYFEGPNKWDLAWHQVDDEFNEFAIDQLNKADGLIFGRVTYQGMASYWSTAAALQDDPVVAKKMNSIRKYVFSRSLNHVDWSNSVLLKGDAVEEFKKIKAGSGKDLFIFGSANLTATFIKAQLIDEYRLMINPIILGTGNSMFPENDGTLKLKLLNSRSFRNGNVLLYYAPGDRS